MRLDGTGRIYLAGSRATTPRHQMVVARVTSAGALDPTYGGLGYRTANLDGASPSVYEVEARRLRVDADGTALVLSTVKSATGPATHLVGLARLTPAGALDASFGTGGTRTQDVSPSHITDMTSLVTLPDGFVVGGAMAVGSTTQFGLADVQGGRHPPPAPRPTWSSAPAARTGSTRWPSRRRAACSRPAPARRRASRT